MLGITGSTGDLGRLVLSRLYDHDAQVILLARDIQKARAQQPAEHLSKIIDIRRCIFTDLSGSAASLRGISTLFFVSATEDQNRFESHKTLIDAAAAAGVRHIVYTSFRGAAPNAIFHHARDHYLTEEYIKAKIPKWTFLRNAFYQDILPHFAVDGVIRGPAGPSNGSGDGLLSPVAKADVADVAATVLLNPERYAGRTLNLTGPEDLSLGQIADLIGGGCRYEEETEDEAWASRRKDEDRDWLIAAWISTYTAIRDGEEAGVSGDIEEVLGRLPIALADTLRKARQ